MMIPFSTLYIFLLDSPGAGPIPRGKGEVGEDMTGGKGGEGKGMKREK